MDELMTVARLLASGVHMSWLLACFALTIGRSRGRQDAGWYAVAGAVWAELKPFYLPALVIRQAHYFGDSTFPLPLQVVFLGIEVYLWFAFRHLGDDDRWKRRRRKLAEKVSRVGSRLVVAPTPGGA